MDRVEIVSPEVGNIEAFGLLAGSLWRPPNPTVLYDPMFNFPTEELVAGMHSYFSFLLEHDGPLDEGAVSRAFAFDGAVRREGDTNEDAVPDAGCSHIVDATEELLEDDNVDEAVPEEPDPDDLAAIEDEAIPEGPDPEDFPAIDDEAASDEPDPDDLASDDEATPEATPEALHDGASSSGGLAVRNRYAPEERLADELVRIIDATPVEALQDGTFSHLGLGRRHMMDDEAPHIAHRWLQSPDASR